MLFTKLLGARNRSVSAGARVAVVIPRVALVAARVSVKRDEFHRLTGRPTLGTSHSAEAEERILICTTNTYHCVESTWMRQTVHTFPTVFGNSTYMV